MMLTYASALLLVRRNAFSGSQHLQSWSASKPFTRGSLREILGRLQKLTKRASTDETLTNHDT
jgi:hypothetical protein